MKISSGSRRWRAPPLTVTAALLALVALAASLAPAPAAAQAPGAYPNRPITIVYPFAPGGPDRVVRLLAAKLQESLKQPVLIDNRPGGSGLVGTTMVRRAAPDGYTLLATSVSAAVLMPLMTKPTPFDSATDFEAVSLLYDYPAILNADPALKVGTLKELVTVAKAQPDRANFGSPGAATLGRLVAEAFKQQSGAPFTHVAYKGIGEAQTALMAGEVQFFVDGPQSSSELIRAGRVKALAVTGAQRLPGLPDVPTFKELGFDGMAMSVWIGVFAPKGTPKAIVSRLSEAFAKAVNSPDVAEQISQGGLAVPRGGPPAELLRLIEEDRATYLKLIRELDLKIE
jgi:tripartite-type tricarboxylate transporter receptor subunit TctC